MLRADTCTYVKEPRDAHIATVEHLGLRGRQNHYSSPECCTPTQKAFTNLYPNKIRTNKFARAEKSAAKARESRKWRESYSGNIATLGVNFLHRELKGPIQDIQVLYY